MAMGFKTEEQVAALEKNLGKIEDAALRRRAAQWMLEELEQDQKLDVQKMLKASLRANTGEAALEKARYMNELEPLLMALRVFARGEALKPRVVG